MIEREPKQTLQQEKLEDHSDIPLYEKLDEESQKFVVEVKELSEMSEEEFLDKYPKVRKFIEKSQKRWKIKNPNKTIKFIILDDIKNSIIEKIRPDIITSDDLADLNDKGIGTMWDLVRLHLLELKDFHDSGQKDFHSRQTDYLAEKILTNIMRNYQGPDELCFVRGALRERGLPGNTREKLTTISYVISKLHQYDKKGSVPEAIGWIADIWRYAVIRKPNIIGDNRFDCWEKQFKDFFDKLSNINLRKND